MGETVAMHWRGIPDTGVGGGVVLSIHDSRANNHRGEQGNTLSTTARGATTSQNISRVHNCRDATFKPCP